MVSTNNQQYQPMHVAPQPPSIALTIVITLLFGIFGLIPAASGSSKAKQLGQPSGKYWGAFFGVFAAYFLLLLLMVGAA